MKTDVDENLASLLIHSGVKGMKWGVRKNGGKYNRNASEQIRRETLTRARAGVKEINRKYTNKSLKDPKVKAQYRQDVVDNLNKHANAVTKERSKRGYAKTKFSHHFDPSAQRWVLTVAYIGLRILAHADNEGEVELIVGLTYDANGFITDLDIPEFDLIADDDEDPIAHWGVKGMHWGVRNDRPVEKAARKMDKHWAKQINSRKANKALNANVHQRMFGVGGSMDKLNMEYRDKDLSHASEWRDQYHAEARNLFARDTLAALNELHGSISPSGHQEAHAAFNADRSQMLITIRDRDLNHAESDEAVFTYDLKWGERGHISDATLIPNDDVDVSSAVEELIDHSGVKGMKWGIRKERARRGFITGTPDSVTARVLTNRANSHGTSHLTNEQLQAVVQRINLENQYAKLTHKPSKAQKAKGYLDIGLSAGKSVNEVLKFLDSPAGKAIKLGLKAKGVNPPVLKPHGNDFT